MSEQTRYHYLPYLRSGLSAHITPSETPSPELISSKRASFAYSVFAKSKGISGAEDVSTRFEIKGLLHGPIDVVNFDSDMVVRTDPKPLTGDFEPNYFPMVEFADPDFPWRFSPVNEDDEGHLMPWLTLIVLVAENRGEDVHTEVVGEGQRRIEVSEDTGEAGEDTSKVEEITVPWIETDISVLPDLTEAWRWAHVQITSPDNQGYQEAVQEAEPGHMVSRLLCARKLMPKTLYRAFVVPTFKLGLVAAGLATEKDVALDTLVWGKGQSGTIKLPYYYQWEFRTGLRGGIEDLIRLLEPLVLTDIGRREMDCSTPGCGIPGVERPSEGDTTNLRHTLHLEGALRSILTLPTPWGLDGGDGVNSSDSFRQGLADGLLNLHDQKLLQTNAGVEIHINTLGRRPKEFSGVSIHPDYTTTQIHWFMTGRNSPRSCGVRYGTDISYNLGVVGSYSEYVTPSVTKHIVHLKELKEGTTYHICLEVTGLEGWVSEEITFTTKQVIPKLTPPIYGRWHRGKSIVDPMHSTWFEELNLDPRHRVAAGLGAEVVRKNQEELMAAAWEQAGDIEKANALMRQAQLGREASYALYRRYFTDTGVVVHPGLKSTVLQVAAPLFSRITAKHGQNSTTLAGLLAKNKPLKGVFDQSLNRLCRSKGPLAKRSKIEMGGLVDRLSKDTVGFQPAGPYAGMQGQNNLSRHARFVQGTISIGDKKLLLEKRLIPETVRESSTPPGNIEFILEKVPARWQRKITVYVDGDVQEVKFANGNVTLLLDSISPGEHAINVRIRDAGVNLERTLRFFTQKGHQASVRLHSNELLRLGNVTTLNPPMTPLSRDKKGLAVAQALESWLNSGQSLSTIPVQQTSMPFDVEKAVKRVGEVLNPRRSIPKRLDFITFHGIERKEDPLERIMMYPEFSTPMYEDLIALSKDYIIPGLEHIPQNTIGVLKTNRRFIEAFMVGCNHEFASELLWREFPTDQRGSYFRQFWDVNSSVPELPEEDLENYDEKLAGYEGEVERLMDIREVYLWNAGQRLGNHPVEKEAKEENLVMVVRGDLFKKYPNTLVYAARAIENDDGQLVPELEEYTKNSNTPRVYAPLFEGKIPADIAFFGFVFTEKQAIGFRNSEGGYDKDVEEYSDEFKDGVFFVMEERLSEARFGADMQPAGSNIGTFPPPIEWNELHWGHFALHDSGYVKGLVNEVGEIPFEIDDDGNKSELVHWDDNPENTAAITLQMPLRIAIHASQMIPTTT